MAPLRDAVPSGGGADARIATRPISEAVREPDDADSVPICTADRTVLPPTTAGVMTSFRRTHAAASIVTVDPRMARRRLDHRDPDEFKNLLRILSARCWCRTSTGGRRSCVRGHGGAQATPQHRSRALRMASPPHLQRHHATAQRGLGRTTGSRTTTSASPCCCGRSTSTAARSRACSGASEVSARLPPRCPRGSTCLAHARFFAFLAVFLRTWPAADACHVSLARSFGTAGRFRVRAAVRRRSLFVLSAYSSPVS